VKSLHEQAEQCNIPYEIIVIDDASIQKKSENQQISALSHTSYIELEKNIGRSKIRNLLAEKAQYDYLLFMDCDSEVSSDDYIKNYIPFCKAQVVCYGGRIYQKEKPKDNTFLRWKYGVERESNPANIRQKNANFGFCSNNFLIDKKIFRTVRFNPVLDGYGHEDTLFGLELLHHNIIIQHIDNPLIHLGLESAETFLKKVENGLKNLQIIHKLIAEKYPEYLNHSKLSHSKNKIDKLHLKAFTAFFFRIFSPLLKCNILGKHPKLFFFDLYRLGYLCNLKN
jgi:glycosyltransferase involved in cell wall biosynthesis